MPVENCSVSASECTKIVCPNPLESLQCFPNPLAGFMGKAKNRVREEGKEGSSNREGEEEKGKEQEMGGSERKRREAREIAPHAFLEQGRI